MQIDRKNQLSPFMGIRFGTRGLNGCSRALLGATLILFLGSSTALGFGEEPTSEFVTPNEPHSTIHYELTRALAVCAGYGSSQAETLARYAQLVDQGSFLAWSENLCQGTLPTAPATANKAKQEGASTSDLVSGRVNGCSRFSQKVFPLDEGQSTCATSRFGGFVDVFHFPTSGDLDMLQTYAMSTGASLSGMRVATYGGFGPDPLSWRCSARWSSQPINIGSNVPSGSLAALGLYLHSKADSGSHFDCAAHARSTDEALNEPTHHGLPGVELCAATHHADELTTNYTPLSETPLWRTYVAVVGINAAEYINDGSDLAGGTYNSLDGLYEALINYRSQNPTALTFPYQPIPADLNDPNYIEMLTRVQSFLNDNLGWVNASGRATSAGQLESWCASTVPGL